MFQPGISGNTRGRPKGSVGGRAQTLAALDRLLSKEHNQQTIYDALEKDLQNPIPSGSSTAPSSPSFRAPRAKPCPPTQMTTGYLWTARPRPALPSASARHRNCHTCPRSR